VKDTTVNGAKAAGEKGFQKNLLKLKEAFSINMLEMHEVVQD
jgi:hypothetical protein